MSQATNQAIAKSVQINRHAVGGQSTRGIIVGSHRHDCLPPCRWSAAGTRRGSAIDMGGGYGGAVYERLLDNGITAHKFNGAQRAVGRTRDGNLLFVNKRTEAYWRLREGC